MKHEIWDCFKWDETTSVVTNGSQFILLEHGNVIADFHSAERFADSHPGLMKVIQRYQDANT